MQPPPGDRAPTLAATVKRLVLSALVDVHTAIPAEIVRFDAATQRADCQPLIQQAYLDEDGVRQVGSLPVVCNVPVVFPGAGGFRVTFPVAEGDTCLLVFSEASLDRWLSGDGQEVDPEIDHRFDLSDAVAILGLRTFGSPLASMPTDRATFGQDSASGGRIEITDDGVVNVISAAGQAVNVTAGAGANVAINAGAAGSVVVNSGTRSVAAQGDTAGPYPVNATVSTFKTL